MVNADSMQLYRGMDIGTAKLTAGGAPRRPAPPARHLGRHQDRQRRRVPAARATRSIAGIAARGKVPVLVGGSGLYVRAALDDLEFPGTDPAVRARLEAELAERGPAPLHARLAAADPAAAAAILPSNGRRIVRALEVIEITGRPFTANLPGHDAGYATPSRSASTWPRPSSTSASTPAVDRMWEAGLRGRGAALEARGLREGRTASRALGYQQVLRYLAGECTQDQARAETVRATKRFARRQDSWFRRDPRVTWLQAGEDLPARALALYRQ